MTIDIIGTSRHKNIAFTYNKGSYTRLNKYIYIYNEVCATSSHQVMFITVTLTIKTIITKLGCDKIGTQSSRES